MWKISIYEMYVRWKWVVYYPTNWFLYHDSRKNLSAKSSTETLLMRGLKHESTWEGLWLRGIHKFYRILDWFLIRSSCSSTMSFQTWQNSILQDYCIWKWRQNLLNKSVRKNFIYEEILLIINQLESSSQTFDRIDWSQGLNIL